MRYLQHATPVKLAVGRTLRRKEFMRTGEWLNFFQMGYYAYFWGIKKPDDIPSDPWEAGQKAAQHRVEIESDDTSPANTSQSESDLPA